MKKTILILLCLSIFSCKNDKYDVNTYFDKKQQDILLTNIITFIYQKAPNSTNQTRFDAQFKDFYQKQLPNFKFQNYYISPDNIHYYFIIRPVGNLPSKRGVIGKFKLGKDLKPTAFEEMVNTPHFDEKTVIERGNFLFKELIKNRNLDKYFSMKHYVEWPDASLVYDKKQNEWVGPDELNPAIKDSIK